MDLIERLTADHETQIIERSDGTTYIEGYAARWYDGTPGTEYSLGGNRVERIEPRAFDKVLSQAEPVECRFNHSRDYTLGDTNTGLHLKADSKGLRYAIPYDPTDPDHVKVRAKIRKGLIRGSSFKASALYRWQQEGGRAIRHITEVIRLEDVGPVDRPAYKGSSAICRAEDEAEIERSYQEWQDYEHQKEETEKRIKKLEGLH